MASVLPPETRRCTIRRDAGAVVLDSAFPTSAHLYDAALAFVLLTTGLLLGVFAAMARRGLLPGSGASPLLALLALVAAVALALQAGRLLRGLHPFRLRLDGRAIAAHAPPGAPLSPAEARPGGHGRGGRRTVTWSEVDGTEVRPEGLVVHSGLQPLLVPWRYRRRGRTRFGTFDFPVAAFRYEELDWIAALIERLRAGDAAALEDLAGRPAPPSTHPSMVQWEEPVFVLQGIDAGRLRLLVVLAAAAVALWFRWRA